jgi:hypothetical protein
MTTSRENITIENIQAIFDKLKQKYNVDDDIRVYDRSADPYHDKLFDERKSGMIITSLRYAPVHNIYVDLSMMIDEQTMYSYILHEFGHIMSTFKIINNLECVYDKKKYNMDAFVGNAEYYAEKFRLENLSDTKLLKDNIFKVLAVSKIQKNSRYHLGYTRIKKQKWFRKMIKKYAKSEIRKFNDEIKLKETLIYENDPF